MGSSYQDEVPPHHIAQIIKEAHDFFEDADRRERHADERVDKIARAHADGWKLVARALTEGLQSIARAVESRR